MKKPVRITSQLRGIEILTDVDGNSVRTRPTAQTWRVTYDDGSWDEQTVWPYLGGDIPDEFREAEKLVEVTPLAPDVRHRTV